MLRLSECFHLNLSSLLHCFNFNKTNVFLLDDNAKTYFELLKNKIDKAWNPGIFKCRQVQQVVGVDTLVLGSTYVSTL